MDAAVDGIWERMSHRDPQPPGREWVGRELVALLSKYPGGLTTAILQTHLHTLWLRQAKQAHLAAPAHGAGGKKALASGTGCLPSASPISDLKQTIAAPEAWIGELDVLKVTRKTAGVLSEANAGADRRLTGATLEVSDGVKTAFLDVHSRFLPHLQGRAAAIAEGSRLRVTGTKSYGKALPGGPDKPPLRLLPSETIVLVQPEASEGLPLATVSRLQTEEGRRKVLQGSVAARVARIGPEESGCSCGLCFFGSRQGRHRWVMLEDLKHDSTSAETGPVSLPLLLFDQQTLLGGLIQEGETVVIDSAVACQLSPAAAEALASSLAAAGRQAGLPGWLCLSVGSETLIRASAGSLPNKRHKGHPRAPGCGESTAPSASPAPLTTLSGQLLSVRLHRHTSGAGSGQLSMPPSISTQKPQSAANVSVVLSLMTADAVQVEVEVTCSCGPSALSQLLRSMAPGQAVVAFPVSPKGVGASGVACRTYSCVLDGACVSSIQSLSVLPGLLSSPQIHRPFVRPLEDALADARATSGGPVLSEAILDEIKVCLRRGFFDDEDMGEDPQAGDDPDLPMSPSGVSASVFDGLWECQFCGQECGSRQLELQAVGVCRLRGSDGSSQAVASHGSVWMPVEGSALEAMLRMTAAQYADLTAEQRLHLEKGLSGRRILLSLAAGPGHCSWASAMPPAGEPVADDGMYVCGAWWPPEKSS